jgi:hypothetical protein
MVKNPLKARRLVIETPLKVLVKSPVRTAPDRELETRDDCCVELRLLARTMWLEITAPKESGYQLELYVTPSTRAMKITCHACGVDDSEVHCYPYVDRFLCENCSEKLAEGG